MFTIKRLTVSGYRGMPVANSFFEQDEKADHLAVVLPGLSYRCSQPLLWYPSRLALATGADVLWVEYAYDLQPDWMGSGGQMQKDWLFGDSAAALEAAMDSRYEKLTLMGKSLGTLAMGHLLSALKLPDRSRCVWLTPVLSDSSLRHQLATASLPSLLVIGTNDHYYDQAFLEELRTKESIHVMEIDGADHILETKAGALDSIDVLKRVAETTMRFISQ